MPAEWNTRSMECPQLASREFGVLMPQGGINGYTDTPNTREAGIDDRI